MHNNSSLGLLRVCPRPYLTAFPQVVPHKNYKSREEFEAAITMELKAARVELICLAGFMRILTGSFVRAWHGRMLNVHPALLPSFKGIHAQRQALQAGVTVTGCTVHFVSVRGRFVGVLCAFLAASRLVCCDLCFVLCSCFLFHVFITLYFVCVSFFHVLGFSFVTLSSLFHVLVFTRGVRQGKNLSHS